MKRVTIIPIEEHQVELLRKVASEIFVESFASMNDPNDMAKYIAEKLSESTLLYELSNTESRFYFAVFNEEVVGYLKLNFGKSQTEQLDPSAMEIERIYVYKHSQRDGIGKQLLDFATHEARSRGCAKMWLGVWEHNAKAMNFYSKNGFRIFGSHPFVLGTDVQTDVLMQKEI